MHIEAGVPIFMHFWDIWVAPDYPAVRTMPTLPYLPIPLRPAHAPASQVCTKMVKNGQNVPTPALIWHLV